MVNHIEELLGYPNMIIADGFIFRTSTGRNQSHTIAEIAERVAAYIS